MSFIRRCVALAVGATLAASVVGVISAGALPATGSPLRILVTNDDGVSADGIDALVQGLAGVPDVEVTVIAPAEDKSGTGIQTTRGRLTATPTTTKGGSPALAVDGFPADTVIYALKHLEQKPDLVMSGINAGANLGAITFGSGTVGAAKMAGRRGIPAVALSQGDEDAPPDYASGVEAALTWLDEHRAALSSPGDTDRVLVENVNIPTCTAGAIRGTLRTKTARTAKGAHGAVSDCASTSSVMPKDDITAFTEGYISVAPVPDPKRRPTRSRLRP
jgi:5'-nucleotidase